MIVVIIAGGSGTRLWPLSTPEYPKHLLSLTNERSLLQNTLDRVKQLTSAEKILVISEASHIKHVYDQLKEVPKDNILVEPARRGTASCVALALATIKNRFESDEAILFVWADHLIRNSQGFVNTALRAGEVCESESKVVFMGVEPTYPSTGLGYIEKDGNLKGWTNIFHLKRFVEKPDKKKAEKYYLSGQFLWNTGYSVGTLHCFEKTMEAEAPDMWHRYQKLLNAKDIDDEYLELENIALEYVFSEKLTNALTIPGTFDWADVGSFKDLHEISLLDDEGNHIRGEKIKLESTGNSYIRNDVDIPTVVIGLDNVVVVHTDHGLLVANKNYVQRVGELSKQLGL
ncbi:MAG: sugar phosphate nucleotidyltransferase [Candidatus Saccharibacteria bacterium]|nr:sugar phosphate nucleotidyltransferase [Candidatus Saccharibacteria bacterium]